MGVCCIVFDKDGMLFEFFMNFLNIENNIFLRILVFNISWFRKEKIPGGGGGDTFFFRY